MVHKTFACPRLTPDFPSVKTIQGHTIYVNTTSDGTATVSNHPIIKKDIYASNGVLHITDSLLLDPSIFKLNAEKYLLALNATSFVSLLRAANMSHYVDDDHDGQPWTILAPQDGVFTIGSDHQVILSALEEDGPPVDMTELKRMLEYHFIPGKIKPDDLDDGSLLGTELREDGLKGGRQVLEVDVHGSGPGGRVARQGNGEIGFGGAMVIGDAGTCNTILSTITLLCLPRGCQWRLVIALYTFSRRRSHHQSMQWRLHCLRPTFQHS